MSLIKRAILALVLAAGIAPAFAQVPPPVPALPDTERRTSYSISGTTCACAVGFQLFGDSTDYVNWLEVFVNGVLIPQSGGWNITSPTGPIATIPRPITDAVLTFTAVQTGTVQIVGARRPRRTSQFQESQPVPTRNFNQIFSDIIATQRELWDKTTDFTGRSVRTPPGESLALLPILANRANMGACFDTGGNLTSCVSVPSSTFITGGGILFTGVNPTTISVNPGPGLVISGPTVATGPSVDANGLNLQAANYAITSTDCGKTVASGGGFFTVTLPAVAGFDPKCTVNVKNTDTYPGGRGKQLIGFPADLGPILWPLQSTTVKIINGAWATTHNPGRWKNPTTVIWHVDKTNGSNSNDGLAAGAGAALLDAQTANTRIVYQSDTQGTTPVIAMACGQTHTAQLNMGGTPVGTNLIQLSPDGNCSFTWTNAGPCISIGDLAELDLNLIAFGGSGSATFGCNISNAAFNGNIYLHNDVVLDVEGTPVWNPAGANDNFLFCDGMCQFTVANGITQATAAGGNYVINRSAGGHGTQSGVISASASGSAIGVYFLFNAMLVLGTPNGAGWASLGSSKVYCHATLVNNGVTPSGGVVVGASGVNCASLTASC
jgi:hypothetical protein